MKFTPATITIKVTRDGQHCDQEIEAVLAEGTGLAYIQHTGAQDEEEEAITITHVPSGGSLGSRWQVSTEREAQAWIESLVEFADWTQQQPTIRPGKLWKVLHLASVGALHEIEEEEIDESAPAS